jgi:hypothetical protein
MSEFYTMNQKLFETLSRKISGEGLRPRSISVGIVDADMASESFRISVKMELAFDRASLIFESIDQNTILDMQMNMVERQGYQIITEHFGILADGIEVISLFAYKNQAFNLIAKYSLVGDDKLLISIELVHGWHLWDRSLGLAVESSSLIQSNMAKLSFVLDSIDNASSAWIGEFRTEEGEAKFGREHLPNYQ